jgi:hypothetical protein
MKLMSRAGLTAGAVAAALLIMPLQSANAGSAADPDVTDAPGDANAASVQNAKLATPPASAAQFDVLSVWFSGGGAVNLKLATAPTGEGLYVVAFDAPGCTMPPPGPPSATNAALDDHPASGVGLAFDLKANVGSAYYVCNTSGNTWGVTYVGYRINGNTITFNIPSSGHLVPGMGISHPYAMSAAGPSVLVDITPRGRNAVL